jgi:type I restriction-modification system DNA methylase subunit
VTDQRIADYLIDIVNPLITDDKSESFADIAMGRGTIIRSYVEHINSKGQNIINWKKQNILGCDINKNIRDIAVLECLFYTGQYLDEQFISCDSLKMSTDRKYMNIVSDMPYSSTHNNIKFVEQCTNMLDDNGKCAIIVPNIFLFCDKYAKTRKYLITSFNIKKIINIDSQFGISYGQSIVFFTKTGITEEINFCEFRINELNNAYEQYMFTVNFDDIAHNRYTLYPNKYGLYFAKKEKGKRQRTKSVCDTSNTVKRNKIIVIDE